LSSTVFPRSSIASNEIKIFESFQTQQNTRNEVAVDKELPEISGVDEYFELIFQSKEEPEKCNVSCVFYCFSPYSRCGHPESIRTKTVTMKNTNQIQLCIAYISG
jgi:hypothetical protein